MPKGSKMMDNFTKKKIMKIMDNYIKDKIPKHTYKINLNLIIRSEQKTLH